MKVIPKLQNGGGAPPFVYYTPTDPITSAEAIQSQVVNTEEQTAAKEQNSDKGKITDKDIMQMISDIDGLPSDINNAISSLSTFYHFQNLFNDGVVDTSSLANQYLRTLQKLKVANFNKEQFDNAYKKVNENNGLSEIAITPIGRVVVQDKDGNMQQVSVQEYMQNTDKYYALTNSNLLSLRAENSNYAFNNSVLSTVENGIGTQTIAAFIDKAISNLGSVSQSKEGYASIQEGKAIKGVEFLQELASKGVDVDNLTIDGIYKLELTTKDQINQAKAAIDYVYKLLPNNARTLLEIKSGNKENPRQGSYDLIARYIASKTNNSHTYSVDLLEGLSPDGNKKSSKKEAEEKNPLDTLKLSSAARFLIGAGTKQIVTINPGTHYSIQAKANTMSLEDSTGKPLGANNTLQDASNGTFSYILDTSNATMGGVRIDPANFGKVVLQDGKISSVDFPYKELADGTIVPDINKKTFSDKLKADKEISELGIDLNNPESIRENVEQINEIYEKYNLPPAYNEDGTLSQKWARFGVINARASNVTLGIEPLEDDDLLQEEEDEAVIDSVIEITKEKFDKDNWYDLNGYDRLYNGTVWIPLNVSQEAALQQVDMTPPQALALAQAEKTRENANILTNRRIE